MLICLSCERRKAGVKREGRQKRARTLVTLSTQPASDHYYSPLCDRGGTTAQAIR